MNTAVYLPINNYSNLGEMGISRVAVKTIANDCILRVSEKGKNKNQFVCDVAENQSKVSFSKAGIATISVVIDVFEGSNITDICTKIQKEITDTMTLMLDTLPFEVQVKVDKVLPR